MGDRKKHKTAKNFYGLESIPKKSTTLALSIPDTEQHLKANSPLLKVDASP